MTKSDDRRTGLEGTESITDFSEYEERERREKAAERARARKAERVRGEAAREENVADGFGLHLRSIRGVAGCVNRPPSNPREWPWRGDPRGRRRGTPGGVFVTLKGWSRVS